MPEIKLVEINPNGKYVLITQGLSHDKTQEIMEGLREFVGREIGAIMVLNFTDDIRWQIVKVEDLAGLIGESTDPQPLDNLVT